MHYEILEKPDLNVITNQRLRERVRQSFENGEKKLSLWNAKITDVHVRELSKILKHCSNLDFLELGKNQISAVGMSHLGEALEENYFLSDLYLSHNLITDDEVAKLSHSLEKNATLKKLFLNDNRISSARFVARALERDLSGLEVLHLGNNEITDNGIRELANALSTNSTLTSLYLYHNHITDRGARALIGGLKSNSTLKEIDISDNRISHNVLADLQRALEN